MWLSLEMSRKIPEIKCNASKDKHLNVYTSSSNLFLLVGCHATPLNRPQLNVNSTEYSTVAGKRGRAEQTICSSPQNT